MFSFKIANLCFVHLSHGMHTCGSSLRGNYKILTYTERILFLLSVWVCLVQYKLFFNIRYMYFVRNKIYFLQDNYTHFFYKVAIKGFVHNYFIIFNKLSLFRVWNMRYSGFFLFKWQLIFMMVHASVIW